MGFGYQDQTSEAWNQVQQGQSPYGSPMNSINELMQGLASQSANTQGPMMQGAASGKNMGGGQGGMSTDQIMKLLGYGNQTQGAGAAAGAGAGGDSSILSDLMAFIV